MKPPLPLCACPESYHTLVGLGTKIEERDGLFLGALALGMDQTGEDERASAEAILEEVADSIRVDVYGRQPQAMIASLHQRLFGVGDNDWNMIPCAPTELSALSWNLPWVLHEKKGAPVLLSIVYKLIADLTRVVSWGVNLPRYSLVGVWCDGSRMLIDPEAQGRVVTPGEARARCMELSGEELPSVAELEKAAYFSPISNRRWLTRILHELRELYHEQHHSCNVASVIELEMALWPTNYDLEKDLALALCQAGNHREAKLWCDQYLDRKLPDEAIGKVIALRKSM